MTIEGEVELNLPREGTEEWGRHREDIRESPGATASGTSATSQEERHRLELPNGARLKWFRHGLPLPSIEEPRSPGMGTAVNVGGPGMDRVGMGVLAPILPTFQQHRQSAGVVTPTRVDVERNRDFRCPGGRLLGNGTQMDSYSYAVFREKDIRSDRRDLPWSPDTA